MVNNTILMNFVCVQSLKKRRVCKTKDQKTLAQLLYSGDCICIIEVLTYFKFYLSMGISIRGFMIKLLHR